MSRKKKNSTRSLLGLQGFTNYGVKTTGGELVVFLVQPTNICYTYIHLSPSQYGCS